MAHACDMGPEKKKSSCMADAMTDLCVLVVNSDCTDISNAIDARMQPCRTPFADFIVCSGSPDFENVMRSDASE